MNTPLAGQTILVTGASRGIGAAAAALLAQAGACVVRMSRSQMPALQGAIDFQVDLADPRARAEALEKMLVAHGAPDGVVSNAGAFLLAPLSDTSDALFREQLSINLEAPLAIARTLLPRMQARGSGSHIIVGSIADVLGLPGNAAYAASKFGVRGLHEVLTEEFRGSPVRFSLISPGPTDTAAWDPVNPDEREGFTRRDDMLRPTDVAEAILWVLTRPAHVQVGVLRLGAI